MKPKDIPKELVDLLDARAGKVHSIEGSVMTTLAEILTRYEELRAVEVSCAECFGRGSYYTEWSDAADVEAERLGIVVLYRPDPPDGTVCIQCPSCQPVKEPEMTSLRVGDIVHGFAQGAFGRDHYYCSRVEAIGTDWVVVRHLDDQAPCSDTGDRMIELCIEARDKPTMHSAACDRYDPDL